MSAKLDNPPLIEVIFELKWRDDQKEDYDLLIGELYSKLKEKFPEKQHLKPLEMPSFLMPFNIQHRFRTKKDGYPLYQLGPGILTFNINGEEYNNIGGWDVFLKQLEEFMTEYKNVSPDKYNSDNLERIQLRFINKIEDPEMYSDLKKYFKEKLRLNINFDFEGELDYNKQLNDMKLAQTYKLDDNSTFELFISTITGSARGILLELRINIFKLDSLNGGLNTALNDAHTKIEDFFNKITNEIKTKFDAK